MKNISKHLPDKLNGTTLMCSPAATAFLDLATGGSKWSSVVAKSAASFITSAYRRKSDWFRTQSTHPIKACVVGNDTPIVACDFLDDTHIVLKTIDEVSLPDDYYEKRVIEETRVEYGI